MPNKDTPDLDLTRLDELAAAYRSAADARPALEDAQGARDDYYEAHDAFADAILAAWPEIRQVLVRPAPALVGSVDLDRLRSLREDARRPERCFERAMGRAPDPDDFLDQDDVRRHRHEAWRLLTNVLMAQVDAVLAALEQAKTSPSPATSDSATGGTE